MQMRAGSVSVGIPAASVALVMSRRTGPPADPITEDRRAWRAGRCVLFPGRTPRFRPDPVSTGPRNCLSRRAESRWRGQPPASASWATSGRRPVVRSGSACRQRTGSHSKRKRRMLNRACRTNPRFACTGVGCSGSGSVGVSGARSRTMKPKTEAPLADGEGLARGFQAAEFREERPRREGCPQGRHRDLGARDPQRCSCSRHGQEAEVVQIGGRGDRRAWESSSGDGVQVAPALMRSLPPFLL